MADQTEDGWGILPYFTHQANRMVVDMRAIGGSPDHWDLRFGEGAMEILGRPLVTELFSITKLNGLDVRLPEAPSPHPGVVCLWLLGTHQVQGKLSLANVCWIVTAEMLSSVRT